MVEALNQVFCCSKKIVTRKSSITGIDVVFGGLFLRSRGPYTHIFLITTFRLPFIMYLGLSRTTDRPAVRRNALVFSLFCRLPRLQIGGERLVSIYSIVWQSILYNNSIQCLQIPANMYRQPLRCFWSLFLNIRHITPKPEANNSSWASRSSKSEKPHCENSR